MIERRDPPDFMEKIADMLEEEVRPHVGGAAEVTLSGLILSLRMYADVERKGL